MSSSTTELETARATLVEVTGETITIDLEDGRTVVVPTEWYPRLVHGTSEEWANYEITSVGVMWPDLDADFSIRGVLLGRKSGESPASFKFWLHARRHGKKVTLIDFVNASKQTKTPRSSRSRNQRGAGNK
ncbi:MAG TPA: DUF2442 domain-containing protein [Tepidisphaeraceae bacterium]|jgi:hypothetical protein